jgi:hypothetical protein
MFVDQAAEDPATFGWHPVQSDDLLVVAGWSLLTGLMRLNWQRTG